MSDAATAGRAPSILRVLRENREVRRIWCAQIVSETGDWLTRLAVTSHVANELEQPALVIAGIQALMIAPYFLVSPFAGVLADRLPRRSVMIAADLLAAFAVLGYLVAFRMPPSPLAHVVLGAIVLVHLGLAGVFESSRTALIAAAARPEELTAAIAVTQVTWSVCIGLGSALGAVVLATAGRDAAVILDSLTFLAGVAILLTVRAGRTAAASGERGGGFGEGIRYLLQHPTAGAMVLPKLSLGFVAMNDLTFAIVGPRELGIPSEQVFGPYNAAIGLGTLIGPMLATRIAAGRPARMRVAIACAFLAEAAIFSGTLFSKSVMPLVAFAGAATAGGAVVWTFSSALLQRATPDRITGRAVAIDLGLLTAACTVSILIGGFLVDFLGFTPRHLLLTTTLVYASGGLIWFAVLAALRKRTWVGDAGRPV